MSLHIIIDGYNLIRQSDRFRRFDNHSLEEGREALIEALASYRRIKPHRITVVFDGTNAPVVCQHIERDKGVNIVFSRLGEIADTVIKKMAAKEKEKALVVSSDREIANYAESQGAAIIDSVEFEEKMNMASYLDSHGKEEDGENAPAWTPATRKKGPSRRLSKKKRRSQRKIGKLF
jgi:uncharacterized protein